MAYAALRWDSEDLCGFYHAYSEHFESEPVAASGSTTVCQDPAGCDAGPCTDGVCDGRSGLWICTDGQGAPQPHDCGASTPFCGNGRCETGENTQNCPSDCPAADYRRWLINVTQAYQLVTAGGVCGPGAPAFNKVVFQATHNSETGNVSGSKGSILTQLAGGVRFIEFDIHDGGFYSEGDYRLGHKWIGNEVDHTRPNPSTDDLTPWLRQVNDWSYGNPGHKPLVVALDLKDSLLDNPSYAYGNLGNLNQKIANVFGPRLFVPAAVPDAWPSVDEMRDRILVVLSGGALMSGSDSTRRAYLRDGGRSPGVAMNGRGQVVEVHDGGNGRLYYWSGEYLPDGRIVWRRHGWPIFYTSTGQIVEPYGQNCAVALNETGYVVVVCESRAGDFRQIIGHVGDDFEMSWTPPETLDLPIAVHFVPNVQAFGTAPTLRFVDPQSPSDPAGFTIREVYKGTDGADWELVGRFDATSQPAAVVWDPARHRPTSTPLYDKATDSAAGRSVHVFNGISYPADTLYYETSTTQDRIRWPQLLFVEYQNGETDAELKSQPFYATSTAVAGSDYNFLQKACENGKVVRAWDFDNIDIDGLVLSIAPFFLPPTHLPPNFPATNHPYESWYGDFFGAACADTWDLVSCTGP